MIKVISFYKYNLLCRVKTDFEDWIEVILLGGILLKCCDEKEENSRL